MEGAPERCTACRTPMVPGELRCRQCGAVYGADNYCERCHNTTGVRRTGDGYRCLACNAPRERKPGTIVSGGDALAAGGAGLASRAAPGLLRAFGALALGGGLVVSAALFYAIGGAVGGALAAGALAAGVGVGVLLLRGGARLGSMAASRARAERELAILALAAERNGALTVTDVVTALGTSSAGAEAALDAMADGSRVSVEVTPDGRIEYVFRELVATRGPRVRVDLESPAEAPEDVDLAEDARPSAARSEQDRAHPRAKRPRG